LLSRARNFSSQCFVFRGVNHSSNSRQFQLGAFSGQAVLTVLLLCSGCVGEEESSDHAASEHSSGEASSTQPYAGLENRSIKALSEKQIEDLLAGHGAGYALAAELNRYPGPAHVLELSSELNLSAEQEQTIRNIYSSVQEEAKPLGRELVDLEAQLDKSFRDKTLTRKSWHDLPSRSLPSKAVCVGHTWPHT
jgi:hypothetical protein